MRYLPPLLLSLITIACSQQEPETIGDRSDSGNPQTEERQTPVEPNPPDSIILAADPWCPHNCRAGSEREGYMVDIAREIFTGAGYTFEYRNYGWARSLRQAREDSIDGVIGALKGDAPDFVFPEHGVGAVAITMYTRPDESWRYQGLHSLEGRTLLVINGYSYSPELDDYIRGHSGDPEQVWLISGSFPLERALKILDQERTDVFAEDRTVMDWFLRHNPDLPAPREAGVAYEAPIHIAFSPGDPESGKLAELIDQGLSDMARDGRLKRIMESYGLTVAD